MLDRRVRLRPKPAAENYVYGDTPEEKSLLSMLRLTNGMVWNYTPVITEIRQANYEMDQPLHTNSGYNNYKNSSNPVITVQGTFYASTGTEALYLLACITFLRSVTLMDFGRKAASTNNPDIAVVGSPPPVLLFSGYGRYMYNDVPVIVKNVSFNYPEDVSYVQVPIDSSTEEIDWSLPFIQKYYNEERGVTVNENEGKPTIGGGKVPDKDEIPTVKASDVGKGVWVNDDGSTSAITGGLGFSSRSFVAFEEPKYGYEMPPVPNTGNSTPSSPVNNPTGDTQPQREINKENNVWVPQKMMITVQIEQQPTPNYMSKEFNLNEFKRGSLLRKGGFI